MSTFVKFLFKPIDNSGLILFRIGFGLLLAIEAFGAIGTGWVRRNLIEPEITFSFIGFEWLQPLPGNGMYFYYGLMGLFALFTMLGWRYRFSMLMYFLMWTGTYLMQKTSYNNHYYLTVLLTGAMVFMPAHRYASLDVWRKPALKSLSCPNWCVLFFMAQLFIVYTFASINKIYPDWLAARPIGIWFSGKQNYMLIGNLLQEEWLQYSVAYGGILFDGLIIPLLFWKRTRWLAFGLSVCFHLFNSAIFGIGIFPYLMILSCVFFFSPAAVRALFFRKKEVFHFHENENKKPRNATWVMAILGVYFMVQIFLPLRHHLYPDSPNWTEEGHRMAWRMMLRTKSAKLKFKIVNNQTGNSWMLDPKEYLTNKQARKVAARPDMCWQFVQFLKQKYKEKGADDISIYAESMVTLNRNRRGPLIKAEVDLAQVEWKRFQHADWLVIEED